jgi:hypothetical protein
MAGMYASPLPNMPLGCMSNRPPSVDGGGDRYPDVYEAQGLREYTT